MNPVPCILVGLVIGAVLGGIIGWLGAFRRFASTPPDHRLEDELRQQLRERTDELLRAREALTNSQRACATAEASVSAADRLLAAQSEAQARALTEARKLQEKAITDLREAFKALSRDALKETQPDFLRLANETLAKFQETAKGDLAQRQQAIATLVKPLEEQLKIYQERLQQSESVHSTAIGEITQHLQSLAQQSVSLANETFQLRRVLSSNQARGRWGEETLHRVVEAAGMSEHCDFTEQTQSGESKPDLLVRLPGDRLIIVDAKVPDLDFLDALDSGEGVSRTEALTTHAAKLRATIRALADRHYPQQFPKALDHVVLFLPAESLFSAALLGDPELIVWASARHIMLATPATLIGLLRAVSVSWQQHSQTENARAIAAAAQELFFRVSKFTEHLVRIRSGLERANNAFNDAVGSHDRMVRPSGEKLIKLGGTSPGQALVEIAHLEGLLRPPSPE